MKRVKVLTTVCILALSFIMALAAQAGPSGGGQEGHGPAGGFHGLLALRQLDLSDDQKLAVSDILKKYAGDLDKARESMQAGRQRMAALVLTDEFDEAAIRQAFQETSADMEEAVVLRAKIFAEIKAVLTAEQLEQLADMQRNREERMAQRKKHGKFRHAERDTWLQTDSE